MKIIDLLNTEFDELNDNFNENTNNFNIDHDDSWDDNAESLESDYTSDLLQILEDSVMVLYPS